MTLERAIHQYQGGIMCLTVDVCSSPTGAAFLFVLPLLVWQLADDNRWCTLITSSHHKMNSYPASSRGIFAVGRGRHRGKEEEKDREAFTKNFLHWASSRPPSRLIHLSDTYTKLCTNAHTSTQVQGLRAVLGFTFMGQKTGVLI